MSSITLKPIVGLKCPKITSLLVAVSLCMAILSACSKADNSLLDNVPDDATFVAVVNMEKVAKNAGCNITSSGVVLPPQMQSRISATIGTQVYESIVKAVPYIDAKHVMVFAERMDFILTYLIKDADGYARAMEEVTGQPETRDGFTVYSGRLVTIVKDGQAWTMEGDAAHVVSEISEVLEKASDKNFTSHRGLVEFIEVSDAAGSL